MLYAADIFLDHKSSLKNNFLTSAVLLATLFIFTLLAVIFVDRIGRRVLFITGSVLSALNLACVAYFNDSGNIEFSLVFGFLFVAFFGMSHGALW